MSDTTKKLTKASEISSFILSGKATFTVVSTKTGVRFTYQVTRAKEQRNDDTVFFVSRLVGPENEHDYTYLGLLIRRPDGTLQFRISKKISENSLGLDENYSAALGIRYMIHHLNKDEGYEMPDLMEFWHSGHCGRCGRLLTTPESINRGLGPKCWAKTMEGLAA